MENNLQRYLFLDGTVESEEFAELTDLLVDYRAKVIHEEKTSGLFHLGSTTGAGVCTVYKVKGDMYLLHYDVHTPTSDKSTECRFYFYQ